MARFDFGGTLADFVVTSHRLGNLDALALSAATLTMWSAQSGGTRYSDLILNGSAASSITVGTDGQVPKFQGPDGVTEMWADGGSTRIRIVTLQGAPGPAGQAGLPGVNAIPANDAVAAYLTTPGATADTLTTVVNSRLAADPTPANAAAAAVTNAIATRPLAETPVFDDDIGDLSFAVTDSNSRRTWIEATRSGGPTTRSLQQIRDGGVSTDPLDDAQSPVVGAGLAYAVTDATGRRTDIELGPDGHLTDRVLALIKTRMGAATAAPTYPDPLTWSHWGDSLTGNGSNGNWTTKLQAKTGATTIYNFGVGGQTSAQIAGRQGGVPPLLAAFTIPASGASGTLTFLNASPVSVNLISLAGSIAGVHGTLNFNTTTSATTFTRDGSGSTMAVTQGTTFIADSSLARRADTVTLWTGRNSITAATDGGRAILSSIQSMLAFLTPTVKRVLVPDLYPTVGEETGTANRTKLDAYNAALLARFPEFYVPMSTYMRSETARVVAGVTWTTQDNTDLANGIVPTSFRVDATHPSDAGGTAIAQVMYDEAHNRGWL